MQLQPDDLEEDTIALAFIFKHKGEFYSAYEVTEDPQTLLTHAKQTLEQLTKQDE